MLNLLVNTLNRHVNHYQGGAAHHSKLRAGPHELNLTAVRAEKSKSRIREVRRK